MSKITENLDIVVDNNNPNLVTAAQAVAIYDHDFNGLNAIDIFHKVSSITISQINVTISKLTEIKDMMKRIVLHKAWLERPVKEWNEELGEFEITDPGELCPVPSTFSNLVERCIELINQDYPLDQDPIFEATSLEDVLEAFSYIVNSIIKNSTSTKDATFDWWKGRVIELTQE
jgi:hypothetical protein